METIMKVTFGSAAEASGPPVGERKRKLMTRTRSRFIHSARSGLLGASRKVALAIAVAAVLAMSPALKVSAQGKKSCTNRLPAPGSLYKGTRVRIPNHCRCNGGTLTVIGGDQINWKTKEAQQGAARQYICGS
jgi:hypothetical protein